MLPWHEPMSAKTCVSPTALWSVYRIFRLLMRVRKPILHVSTALGADSVPLGDTGSRGQVWFFLSIWIERRSQMNSIQDRWNLTNTFGPVLPVADPAFGWSQPLFPHVAFVQDPGNCHSPHRWCTCCDRHSVGSRIGRTNVLHVRINGLDTLPTQSAATRLDDPGTTGPFFASHLPSDAQRSTPIARGPWSYPWRNANRALVDL